MNINGRMKVKTLKTEFKEEFGLTLRVYENKSFADDDSTLASIRKGEANNGEFAPKLNMKVGNFEDKMQQLFGIKVQVAGSDDSYLLQDDLTLAAAQDKDSTRKKRNKTQMNQQSNAESMEGEIIRVEYTGPIHHYRIYQSKENKEYSSSDELSNDTDLKLIIEQFLTDTWDGNYEPNFTNKSNVPHIFGCFGNIPLTTKGSWLMSLQKKLTEDGVDNPKQVAERALANYPISEFEIDKKDLSNGKFFIVDYKSLDGKATFKAPITCFEDEDIISGIVLSNIVQFDIHPAACVYAMENKTKDGNELLAIHLEEIDAEETDGTITTWKVNGVLGEDDINSSVFDFEPM